VYAEARRLDAGEQMACTMVLAVVVNGDTLYIANAGDSRIYLCREGDLKQLTRDHTFANVMVWLGKLSPEAAANNPDAGKVMRVLGVKENVQVDQGIYLTTSDYGEANRIGRAGFALQTGDSILLCSDGLIKTASASGGPLVAPAEIVGVLQSSEGLKAARSIMGIALGRIPVGAPVDNITVALLQTEDLTRTANQARLQRQQQQQQQQTQRRRIVVTAVLVAVPLLLLLGVSLVALGGFFVFNQRALSGTATQLAQATAVALAATQTVQAYTPTPTVPTPTPTPSPTVVPTLVAGEIAKLFDEQRFLEVLFDDRKLIQVPSTGMRFIAVNHKGQGDNGDLFLMNGSQIQLDLVIDPRVQLQLLSGSELFAQSGPYPNGMEVEFVGTTASVRVRGCLATTFLEPTRVTAACFDGSCEYRTTLGGEYTQIPEGQQVSLDLQTAAIESNRAIPPTEARRYWDFLQQTGAGRADATRCNVPPPPTPTRTRTPVPSATPQPTAASATSGSEPQPPTSTPAPNPTVTPVPPTNTFAPVPTETNTPAPTRTVPPTATRTPIPPTDTNTPVPPTATPSETDAPALPTETFTPEPPTNTPPPPTPSPTP
jgi:serine/threonine protein phosphatase PrpC